MIRVDSITITEFRGIRDLTLNFKGKNFAVCGPNGTGKSGVVDALEFVLTGNVSRLSGEGRGDISLRQHGPHVDRRNNPEKARVKATISIPSLGKQVVIERPLRTPGVLNVTPSEPAVLKVLQDVKAHPEIVLSRRELIRYVIATPGQRAEEVQSLLHLDQVEQVRVGLQRIANSCERQMIPLAAAASSAKENFVRALEISEMTKEKVLTATNIQRTILGLPPLVELTSKTSLKDGMATPRKAKPQRIPKAQALADLQSTRELLNDLRLESMTSRIGALATSLSALAADPNIAVKVAQESFYSTGLELMTESSCPFCDNEWDASRLREHVRDKLAKLKEAEKKRRDFEAKMTPVVNQLRRAHGAVDSLIRYATMATPPLNTDDAQAYCTACRALAERLTTILPLSDTIAILPSVQLVPVSLLVWLDTFEKAVMALPEPTKQDAAREWLTVAQERLEVWREAMRKQKAAKDQAERAKKVFDLYMATSDTVLEGMYAAVEQDFTSLYAFVNRTDEDGFKAKLIPSMGKLGFDVDFYGRGFFPPGAYHSEGHQDGMGLCLYLALMKHIQGHSFTFAVLDDVLMSVDAGHRREVCTLLKRDFPKTQFIMTTHDPIWLRHMRTEGLTGSGGSVQFRNWNVDYGPTRWDERDVWAEIDHHLNDNDVRAAAALLRHYLEYTAGELCHRLRAPVEFRGDAQYELGELLPAAIRHMKALYRRAKDAANSWNQKDIVEQLSERDTAFASLAEASKIEQWQVNAAVHFNNWDNLVREDFQPVVKAFCELLAGFGCSDCNEYLRVFPDRETAESVRCECNKINLNLRKKP